MENQTKTEEILLLGFTESHQPEMLLFALILVMYLMATAGNILIVIITLVNFHLRTPMYYFLRNYAILEIGYTSEIIPKALINLALGKKTISYTGCINFFLPMVMSFDRYVAICNPLRYATIMNQCVCTWMVLISWIAGFILIFGQTISFAQFPICGSNIIDHFFCDNKPLMKLLCGDTHLLELVGFIVSIFLLLGTLAITTISYTIIISAILRIPTTAGRKKAFSTCASHIIMVSVMYGSCISMYLIPKKSEGKNFNNAVAILKNVVCLLMTPFVYTLRNKQVKDALKDDVKRTKKL
uniref:G-protein coupled receptors family 1 profile domain-containing protein n=1 Tax=Laticauda laticaudata TaxID=8630 RepID=A0A8C5WT26_LATLA